MNIRKIAVITAPDNTQSRALLIKEEPRVFRWHNADGGCFDLESFLDETTAISRMRHWFETETGWQGYDLTIQPVSPPPEERAAVATTEAFSDMLCRDDAPEIEAVIRRETNTSPLVEKVETLLAHFINVLGNTDPLAAKLMHGVVVELEKTKACELAGLKKLLSTPPAKLHNQESRIVIPKGRF